MKILATAALALILGITVGWFGRGEGEKGLEKGSEADLGAMAVKKMASKTMRTATNGESPHEGFEPEVWMPHRMPAFMNPQSEEEHMIVQRLMRAALEEELRVPRRMQAINDLMSMMTPENAHDIRDAFNASWNAGFDYAWERSIFFARYGEVMGREATEEFLDGDKSDDLARVVTSWSLVDPTAAVEWINEVPDSSRRNMAVQRIMFGAGMTDPSYAVEVWESMDPEQ